MNFSSGGGYWVTANNPLVDLSKPHPVLGAAGIFQSLMDPEVDRISYEPETVDSFELGLKAEYMEGRGRVNVAAFSSEFDDIQTNSFTGTQFITFNADTAKTQGIELENTFLLTEGLSTNLAVTWLNDASFGDDQPPGLAEELSGRDLSFAPDWAASARLNYERGLTDNIEGYVDVNISYMGDHLLSNDVDTEDSYTVFGLSVGLRSPDGTWDVSVGCGNCTDETYLTNAFNQPFMGALAPDRIMVNLGAPRTWLVTLGYNFF